MMPDAAVLHRPERDGPRLNGPGRSPGKGDGKMDGETDKPRTRIQIRNREAILDAALEVFSQHGFRGATVDMIAEAGLSKPNLLYYFPSKEDIHVTLLSQLMDTWLDPLRALDAKAASRWGKSSPMCAASWR
jgi:AcrR family transcriptional regulator